MPAASMGSPEPRHSPTNAFAWCCWCVAGQLKKGRASSAMRWEALANPCHAAYRAGMRPTVLAVTARGAEKHVAASPCPGKSLLAGSCGSWSSGASSCSKHAA